MRPIPGRYWLGIGLALVVIAGVAIGIATLATGRQPWAKSPVIQSFNAQTYQVVLDKTADDRPAFGSMNLGIKDYTDSDDYVLPVRALINRGELVMAQVPDGRVRVADAPVGADSTAKFACPEKAGNSAPQELVNGDLCWLDLTLAANDRHKLGL